MGEIAAQIAEDCFGINLIVSAARLGALDTPILFGCCTGSQLYAGKTIARKDREGVGLLKANNHLNLGLQHVSIAMENKSAFSVQFIRD